MKHFRFGVSSVDATGLPKLPISIVDAKNMLISFMKDPYQGMKLLSFLFCLLGMIIKN